MNEKILVGFRAMRQTNKTPAIIDRIVNRRTEDTRMKCRYRYQIELPLKMIINKSIKKF